ncbi:MAG: ABC transporter substrate-binding protein [Acidobacteriota bacterium]
MVLVLLCAAACVRTPPPTLTVAEASQPSTFDPHLHNEIAVWSTLSNVCEGLVGFSPDMRIEPALASSWRALDPLRTRFELRPGASFHDGTPVTAADVVASFTRAASHPRSAVRHHLAGVARVLPDGDAAVIVETAAPSPTLLNRLVFVSVIPRSQAGDEEIGAPIGSGPYRWAASAPEGAVTLEAAAGRQPAPDVREVRFVYQADDYERADAFVSGKTDICVRIPEDVVADIGRRPKLRLVSQPRLAVQILTVIPEGATGIARTALADARVRRALLIAIDREALVNQVYRGLATAASQYAHPAVFGYDPGIAPLRHDPGEARRLLAEAGYGEGFEATLGHGRISSGAMERIVADLAAVGVRVALVPLPFGDLVERMRERSVALAYFARTCTTGDVSEYLDAAIHSPEPVRRFGGENYGAFSDSEVDRLLEAAATELDPARRLELLQMAQRRALEGLPALPLTVRWGYLGVPARLEMTPRHDEWMTVAAFRWVR